MNKKYGLLKRKTEFPERNLLSVPHDKGVLIASFPAFGPNYFSENVEEMSQKYSNAVNGETISFREPLTQESISIAQYGFGSKGEVDFKRDIFNSRWLQAGRHILTQEGIFTNTNERDEKVLSKLLNGAKKVNGIYLIDNQGAFIPYDSFKQGAMSSEEFCEQGLARGLEHTSSKKAKNLAKISSKKNYSNGVWVGGWDSVNEPIERISVLGSNDDGSQLYVGGLDWFDDGDGYAFGVLKKM